jgi:hypothetical protein
MIAGWLAWRLVQSHHVGIDEEDLIEIDDDERPPLPPPIPRAALEAHAARPPTPGATAPSERGPVVLRDTPH